MGIRDRIRTRLVKQFELQYVKELEEKKVTYEEWLAGGRGSDSHPNGAKAQSEGSILLLQAREGVLAQGAEDCIRSYFDEDRKSVV